MKILIYKYKQWINNALHGICSYTEVQTRCIKPLKYTQPEFWVL